MKGWCLILNHIGSYVDGFVFTLFGQRKGWSKQSMRFEWKRLLGFSQDDVLGLDIGSSSVRMVKLARENDGFAVVAASISDIDQTDGDVDAREDNAVKAVQRCMASARTRARWAVCSVSGPEVAVRHFNFPPLQPAELEGAVRLEASQVCPFNVDDGVVEYQNIQNGATDNVAAGVLVAATNQVIQRKVRIVEKASLNCVLMDVDGLALLNCLIESKKDGSQMNSSAILDVGASCTTLAVMGENNLPFMRTVPYAGNDIVNQIARDNNVSPEVVKKDIYGSTRPTIPPENLRPCLENACQKLISDVAETLRYHSAQAKSSPVEQILVCGGFGMVKGFVDILNKHLPIRAILWNPFDTMRCSVGRQCLDVIQVNGPAMAVAAGLAMRSV
jgi:type IV pilus assembly protein PilM